VQMDTGAKVPYRYTALPYDGTLPPGAGRVSLVVAHNGTDYEGVVQVNDLAAFCQLAQQAQRAHEEQVLFRPYIGDDRGYMACEGRFGPELSVVGGVSLWPLPGN
jgi:hypothetical protein